VLWASAPPATAQSQIVFQTVTPHHSIQVIDQGDLRILSFDGAQQTRMSLRDPLTGHFQYTELFHMALLWHMDLTNVLMVGLGGGSVQRSFAHYYSNVTVETVEIDPEVVRIAREYFAFKESPQQRVHVSDGRAFLLRTRRRFGAIFMDAYTENRYGCFVPPHLVTKEFFELAKSRLSTNGVLVYNVIGRWRGGGADLVGALYRTLQAVFPQVYAFKARDSQNVVLVATLWPHRFDFNVLQQRLHLLAKRRPALLPTFRDRLYDLMPGPPPSLDLSPVLTDDFAPVESLMDADLR
jgi:spermidine synthase